MSHLLTRRLGPPIPLPGLYIFDLKRRERVRLWQEAPFSGALCFVRGSAGCPEKRG